MADAAQLSAALVVLTRPTLTCIRGHVWFFLRAPNLL
eukprot:COSAG05_NODE_10251_length_575_cov_1.048319_1_plen_36_part_01